MIFLYYLKLALRSIMPTPLLSLVTVAAIAIGISVSMTMVTVRHVFDADPIPEKSSRLFNVRVDNWDPNSVFFAVAEGSTVLIRVSLLLVSLSW